MNDDDLVTAATFGDHTQAVVARMHLQEAGIPAFLSDEWMSQGLFVLGSAAGGVQLQVPAARLQEAIQLINDRLPDHASPVDWSEVDVGAPEPEETIDEDESIPPPALQATPNPTGPVEEIEPVDLTTRERRANRIVRGALVGVLGLIGVLTMPLYALALWRLIQIANSKERLRPEYQRKANLAAIIILAPLLLLALLCCIAPIYAAVQKLSS